MMPTPEDQNLILIKIKRLSPFFISNSIKIIQGDRIGGFITLIVVTIIKRLYPFIA